MSYSTVGLAKLCPHCGAHGLENVWSEGGAFIGEHCRLCGVIYGFGKCTDCGHPKRFTAVSGDGQDRFCGDDCLHRFRARTPAQRNARRAGVR